MPPTDNLPVRRIVHAKTGVSCPLFLPLPLVLLSCRSVKVSKGLQQAYQLQDFAFEAAMALKESLTKEEGKLKIAREDAQAIAHLTKSWESAQERVFVHRHGARPGTLKPKPPPKPTKRYSRGAEIIS